MNTDEKIITIQQEYNAPLEKVWQALTDKDQMRLWYFNVSDFEPVKGFEFHFEAGPPHKLFMHLCKVKKAVKEQKLAYTWRYEGYDGDSLVSFNFMPENQRTKLILTHEGLESFPPDPDFAIANFRQGWTEILGTNLRNFVEK